LPAGSGPVTGTSMQCLQSGAGSGAWCRIAGPLFNSETSLHVPPDSAPASAASGAPPAFADLSLSAPVLQALRDIGYEAPSPIQAATIPVLMAGRDVIGQAQTGTGKTAAFALPILSGLDAGSAAVQALVL